MDDRSRLERFVSAQGSGGTYERAVEELRQGRKTSHWMWFVFPQIAGLGRSQMSQQYAISSLDEAKAYLDHPILGPRLIECAGIVADSNRSAATEIFGALDAQKLRSSMTLFMRAAPEEAAFRKVLERYFHGSPDAGTDELISARPVSPPQEKP
ncbi:MAG TPA: DUF1810 domain-containing protein [Acidimicrobiales bacterium]|nr:DUF1810 domain-containing protein [Acidimicrobiales bacterium]